MLKFKLRSHHFHAMIETFRAINNMKGYIKGQSIILTQPLPENIQDGDEVEVSLSVVPQKKYPFPTFDLKIKDEYLNRKKMYESD